MEWQPCVEKSLCHVGALMGVMVVEVVISISKPIQV